MKAEDIWKEANSVVVELAGQLFKLRPVTTADLARVGFSEVVGVADVGAALAELTDAAAAYRKRETPEETRERRMVEAGEAVKKLMQSPVKKAQIAERGDAYFRAGCVGFGIRKEVVGFYEPVRIPVEQVAGLGLVPVQWVTEYAEVDPELATERVHISIVPEMVRLALALMIEALGREEGASMALRTFRGGR